jgi:anhydro-N-acetylmuramic acid kinase
MSGTSADGVDLALVELTGFPPHLKAELLQRTSRPYPTPLRGKVLQGMRGFSTPELARLHHELGRFYAEAAADYRGSCDLASLHGQTLWHEPPMTTLQIGETSYLAEVLGVPVVSDFRPADLALGGEGAPLVPYPDLLLYGQPGVRRALHNLGGISNLTYLPGTEPEGVLAFDTGPGNCLLDEAAARLGFPFDRGGALARQGTVHRQLLHIWLEHP